MFSSLPPRFTDEALVLMSPEPTSDYPRCHDTLIVESGKPITSALMFSTGVVGNILALVLLEVRRGKSSSSLYRVLVVALLTTDLLGTISVSPIVLASYAQRTSLLGMSAGNKLCSYFGFSMTMLTLSTLGLLCAMALERYISIGHPYFYKRHLSKSCGYITIVVIFLFSMLFCVGPFIGFGGYVQYCPGTWCFLKMSHANGYDKVYIGFYASFILVMILTTVVCNIYVICHLVMMHRRGKLRRSGVSVSSRHPRSLSMSEEMDHLLPLAIITVVFIVCTCPLAIQVYLNFTGRYEEKHSYDLGALRLLSTHSIINPWVFIILRPSFLRTIWRKLHKQQKSTFPHMWSKTLRTEGKPTGERVTVDMDS